MIWFFSVSLCCVWRGRFPAAMCPDAEGLTGVCFLISAQQLFQKLKNLMRPYSVEFESPLELSAQGESDQTHPDIQIKQTQIFRSNTPRYSHPVTSVHLISSVSYIYELSLLLFVPVWVVWKLLYSCPDFFFRFIKGPVYVLLRPSEAVNSAPAIIYCYYNKKSKRKGNPN